MSVGQLSASSQRALQGQTRVAEHVDGGLLSLLSHCDALPRRVHSQGANSAATGRSEVGELSAVEGQEVNQVPTDEHDRVVIQDVEVTATEQVVAERVVEGEEGGGKFAGGGGAHHLGVVIAEIRGGRGCAISSSLTFSLTHTQLPK